MNETRNCQNCKKDFVIEPEDFGFYERIKVPPPTWCPECRLQRRMLVRNDHFLYRSVSSKSGEPIFSSFPPESGLKVFSHKEWLGDDWDQNESGREYEPQKPFLAQFRDLLKTAPLPAKSVTQAINSEYSNNSSYIKNCYLSFGLMHSEGMLYCENASKCKDCLDCSLSLGCEFSSGTFLNQRCSVAHYSSHCEDCHNIYFCRDCIGVSNCIGCVGLKNKSYQIFNEQYSKEEYLLKLKEFNLGSRQSFKNILGKARDYWLKYPVKYARNYKNEDCSGEYISNSKNVKSSYYIDGGENLKFCHSVYVASGRDSYDQYRFGSNSELVYESCSCGDHVSNVKFSYGCFNNSHEMEYSFLCSSSSHLFGCVGLHGKKYCILNKQYTEEEYKVLVPKIIKQMSDIPYVDGAGRTYRYGEFFPPEIGPLAYNESIAQEYFPKTKEGAEEYGSFWRDPGDKNYVPTVRPENLPDRVGDVQNGILDEILECSHLAKCNHQCARVFKIIPDELEFYRKFQLPLPDTCPNCRYFERISQRAPVKMWHRKCQCGGSKSSNEIYQNMSPHQHGMNPCSNEFETSYAPDRPEIVYCEQCYNAEVA